MRYLPLIILSFLTIHFQSCIQPQKTLSVHYEVQKDGDKKMLNGVINRSLVENDTAFAWFKENSKYGNPDAAAVEAFKKNKNKFGIIAFGGTWCSDTKNLLPLFYKLADQSGYPEKNISLVAVDRAKHDIKNYSQKYGITNVPTFIVIYNGKELGRVVEYGKTGDLTKELGAIVASIK